MNNENTAPAGDLADEQIAAIREKCSIDLICESGVHDMWATEFSRAIIAADRALRASPAPGDVAMPVAAGVEPAASPGADDALHCAITLVTHGTADCRGLNPGLVACLKERIERHAAPVGDVAMPVMAWRVSFNGGLSWTIYEKDPSKNIPKGTTFVAEPLIDQSDAQAALAAKDLMLDAKCAEIEALKLRLLSASEGSQRAKEAEVFYRDAERILTMGEKELHGQIAALTAERDALLAVAMEFDRLTLVIESAVRHSSPENHASVMALIRLNRAAMTKEPE